MLKIIEIGQCMQKLLQKVYCHVFYAHSVVKKLLILQ